ncbi:hypothetical protein [Mesorhizobium sp. M1396]|uniref:hypothetical protein n=1 Tax=Mesorhizobium sp. M1396 TaxID=2957095 RepID=UPI003336FC38
MGALALSLVAKFWPYLIAAGAALAGLLTAYSKGRASQKAKQAAKELVAAQDRLEMDREATAAERSAAGMTDDQARAEATRWIKR